MIATKPRIHDKAEFGADRWDIEKIIEAFIVSHTVITRESDGDRSWMEADIQVNRISIDVSEADDLAVRRQEFDIEDERMGAAKRFNANYRLEDVRPVDGYMIATYEIW